MATIRILMQVVWCATVAGFAAWLCGRASDDVFITYRFARSLHSGQGLVFNPGERTFGISDPAVGIALAGLARLTGLEIPALGTGSVEPAPADPNSSVPGLALASATKSLTVVAGTD